MPFLDLHLDRHVSGLDPTLKPTREFRRIEVITGLGGRRRWDPDDKARIVAETDAPGAVVSEIARRHGLSPQQLFGWRRTARKQAVESAGAVPRFVPAVLASEPTRGHRRQNAMATIEVEIGGAVVRIGDGARTSTVAAVIRALKSPP